MSRRRPNDGFRHRNGTLPRPQGKSVVPDSSPPSGWDVVDDWPAGVPVSTAELEVLETFMADILSELLGPSSAATDRPRPRKNG